MRNFFDNKQNLLKGWDANYRPGILFLTVMLVMVWMCVLPVRAENEEGNMIFSNPDTGYDAIIEDDASLLTAEEQARLLIEMQEITQYGNVAFKTIKYNSRGSSETYIKDYYYGMFGTDSGTVFLIDMDYRNIWIHSNGAIYKVINKGYANTITDNVYTYASDADYYTCAFRVFEQELALLQGQQISQPMKYASNAFLAIIIALLINYFIVKIFSNAKKPSEAQLIEGLFVEQKLSDFCADFSHETKRYSPQSSGSGGGGGSSGGGGGGGGGGGHSF